MASRRTGTVEAWAPRRERRHSRRTDARVIRMPLSSRTRKLLLLVHIAAAGIWLGVDLALGILVVTALTADATGAGAAAASLVAVSTWPLVDRRARHPGHGGAPGARHEVRAGALPLGAREAHRQRGARDTRRPRALARHGDGLGEAGRAALADGAAPAVTATLVFPPVVSSTALVVAMTLSVFKPWGRTRRVTANRPA